MKQWLRDMRNKSKAAKDRLAFFGAVLFTGVVAGFWMLSFHASVPTVVEDKGSFDETKSAFATFFKSAKVQMATVLQRDDMSATSTATTTISERAPAIVMPDLSSSSPVRVEHPILIATSSATTTE